MVNQNYQGLVIGSYDGSRDFFKGLIDELAIYNIALSAEEVQQHYESGLNGSGYCEPTVIYVPENYPTIQEAIDAAAFLDTVIVAEGTYYENITLKNGLTIQGAGASGTIIDGRRDGPVVTASACGDTTVFEGFTLQNGAIGGIDGAGIDIDFASPVIRNNIIRNNQGWGIGIFEASTPRIEGNIISHNLGGIVLWESQPTITGNIISGNTGYGIETAGTSVFTITSNLIAENGSNGLQFGFPLSMSGDVDIVSNTIVGNSGAGIECNRSPFVLLRNNIVVNNEGCGIFFIHDSGWGEPSSDYNDVWDNAGGDYCGLSVARANDISEDPLFVDADNGDYHLMDYSPCIGAGIMTPDVPIADLENNIRPNPPYSNPDMGAYETSLAEPAPSCIVQLAQGWNLISVPLYPPDIDPGNVLLSINGKYNSVWACDPDIGWSIYTPDGPSDLEEMRPGRGYWIKMDEAGTLILQGTAPEQTTITLIGNAWNLVGYTCLEFKNAEECMSNVASDINSVWEYGPHDAVVKSWSIYAPRGPRNLQIMKPGHGYWIKADQTCEWDVNAP